MRLEGVMLETSRRSQRGNKRLYMIVYSLYTCMRLLKIKFIVLFTYHMHVCLAYVCTCVLIYTCAITHVWKSKKTLRSRLSP